MSKLLRAFSWALAMLTHYTAVKGAGLASEWGWYQPKVPERLCK